jgi:thiol-disulfide isomerase/thioredoxin
VSLTGCLATSPEPRTTGKARVVHSNVEASTQRALDARSPAPAMLFNEPTRPRETLDVNNLRFVGMDDGPVPDFSLTTYDGNLLKSEEFMGEEAFVVMFFATWCPVCEQKIPLLKNVLEDVGPVKTILVSVDGAQTWPHVPGYLKEHRVEFPVVSAQAYPNFSASYNPFQAVPLVVVVGKNGGLVDYQMGFADSHEKRLVDAITLARKIGPLKDSEHGSAPVRYEPASGAKATSLDAD